MATSGYPVRSSAASLMWSDPWKSERGFTWYVGEGALSMDGCHSGLLYGHDRESGRRIKLR